MWNRHPDGGFRRFDVLRNPDQPSSAIVRYFVDPTKPDGHAWQLHDVTIDINSTDYATGRTISVTVTVFDVREVGSMSL